MKISMIGAGKVGSTTIYEILQKGIAEEMVLIDINKELAEGEAMDIIHSSPFSRRAKIYSGDYKSLDGSEIVLISAGLAQKDGETRLDLINKNAKLIKEFSENIAKYAPHSIIILITNPVDVLTNLAQYFSGFEKNRVFGTGTVLDTARFRTLIAEHCNVSPSSVHAYIIGEHGDSELAVWSAARMGGISVEEFCKSCPLPYCCGIDKELIFTKTKNAAYEIIKRKGATNFAIASATANILESLIKNEKRILTVSAFYEDTYIGYPSVIGKDGVERLIEIRLDEKEKIQFGKSRETIKNITDKVLEQYKTL